METIKIEQDGNYADVLKCKADEILFVRYDPEKDADTTLMFLQKIINYCRESDIPCLCIPKSDDAMYLDLEQWELDRLRNLDSKLQEIIRKKSPLILT